MQDHQPDPPLLLVVGDPVTEKQASEIILRTTTWPLAINDMDWAYTVHSIAAEHGGMPEHRRDPEHAAYATFATYRVQLAAWRERIGSVDVHQLRTERIGSASLLGPHGWCDWDGRIHANTYTIGRNAHPDAVFEEWQNLAAAFPFLSLTSQLVADGGHGAVIAQYRVRAGMADHDPEPAAPLCDAVDLLDDPAFRDAIGAHGRERGCTPERLIQAFADVPLRSPRPADSHGESLS